MIFAKIPEPQLAADEEVTPSAGDEVGLPKEVPIEVEEEAAKDGIFLGLFFGQFFFEFLFCRFWIFFPAIFLEYFDVSKCLRFGACFFLS